MTVAAFRSVHPVGRLGDDDDDGDDTADDDVGVGWHRGTNADFPSSLPDCCWMGGFVAVCRGVENCRPGNHNIILDDQNPCLEFSTSTASSPEGVGWLKLGAKSRLHIPGNGFGNVEEVRLPASLAAVTAAFDTFAVANAPQKTWLSRSFHTQTGQRRGWFSFPCF